MNATDPMAAVRHYVNAFNAGDIEAMAAVFSDSGAIIDGMAPHLWLGPTACRDWYVDVLAEGAHAAAERGRAHGGEREKLLLRRCAHLLVAGEPAVVHHHLRVLRLPVRRLSGDGRRQVAVRTLA